MRSRCIPKTNAAPATMPSATRTTLRPAPSMIRLALAPSMTPAASAFETPRSRSPRKLRKRERQRAEPGRQRGRGGGEEDDQRLVHRQLPDNELTSLERDRRRAHRWKLRERRSSPPGRVRLSPSAYRRPAPFRAVDPRRLVERVEDLLEPELNIELDRPAAAGSPVSRNITVAAPRRRNPAVRASTASSGSRRGKAPFAATAKRHVDRAQPLRQA